MPLLPETIDQPAADYGGAYCQRPQRMQTDRLDGADRHVEFGGWVENSRGDLRAHGGCQSNATPVIPQACDDAVGRLMDVRVLIRRHGKPPAPGVGPRYVP